MVKLEEEIKRQFAIPTGDSLYVNPDGGYFDNIQVSFFLCVLNFSVVCSSAIVAYK